VSFPQFGSQKEPPLSLSQCVSESKQSELLPFPVNMNAQRAYPWFGKQHAAGPKVLKPKIGPGQRSTVPCNSGHHCTIKNQDWTSWSNPMHGHRDIQSQAQQTGLQIHSTLTPYWGTECHPAVAETDLQSQTMTAELCSLWSAMGDLCGLQTRLQHTTRCQQELVEATFDRWDVPPIPTNDLSNLL
jgi:hypothetical protein